MKKFAIVGCGRIAEKHADAINRLDILSAVCDNIPEKAEAFASKFNATPYSSIDDLLVMESEVDTIVICTPNGYHAEHAIKSLQAERNVLIESPLCLKTAAAWQMIETEKYCRKRLFLVSPYLYNPSLVEVSRLIKNNELGKIYGFQLSCFSNQSDDILSGWKSQIFPGGGALYVFFSFYLDVMLWLLGDVKEARGFHSKLANHQELEFEDTGTVSLLMSNGIIGSINWSLNNRQEDTSLIILTEKGTLRISGKWFETVNFSKVENFKSTHSDKQEQDTLLGRLYIDLVESLDKKEVRFPGLFDGLRLVSAIEKIYKSIS